MSTPFHSSSNTTPDAPTGSSNVAIVTGASSGIGLEVTKRRPQKAIAWLRIPEILRPP